MHHIIQRDIRPLRERLTRRHPNRHILQIAIRVRQRRKDQRLVLRPLRRVRQADRGHLLAGDVEAGHGDGAALGEALRRAGVGAEAEVEAGQVEGFDARAAHELRVGVEGELAELEQVDGAGGAGLVGGRVWDDAGGALDGLLGWGLGRRMRGGGLPDLPTRRHLRIECRGRGRRGTIGV